MRRVNVQEAVAITLGVFIAALIVLGLTQTSGRDSFILGVFIAPFIGAALADFFFRRWKFADSEKKLNWGAVLVGTLAFPVLFFVTIPVLMEVLGHYSSFAVLAGFDLAPLLLVFVPSVISLLFVIAFMRKWPLKAEDNHS